MRFFTISIISCLLFFACNEKKQPYATLESHGQPMVSENTALTTISVGNINRIEAFPSKHVRPRNVDIWLPDTYNKNEKYAVLYMHDGQMLFDATTTWNKQEWGIDETLSDLLETGRIKKTIVVGIWNHPDIRHLEYFPQKPFESLPQKQKDSIIEAAKASNPTLQVELFADRYLKFIVEELKPYIDTNYSTLSDQQNTYIAGSSMGALIAMYAMCEYPKVFGGAACLSTHWIGTFNTEHNPIPQSFFDYMRNALPSPENHKFYFDYGTETLDRYYEPFQTKADDIMSAKGYTSEHWITRKFEGDDHSENSWKKRVHIPLTFLLGKTS